MAEDVRHNQSAQGFDSLRQGRAYQTFDSALNSETIARLRKKIRRWRRSLPIGSRLRHGSRPTPGHRIADQLRLIVAVPLVAVVAFAGLALVTTAHEASRTGQLREQATLVASTGSLAHALQTERAAAAMLFVTDAQAQVDEFTNATFATDRAVTDYRKRRKDVDDDVTLQRIDQGLSTVGDLRKQARSGAQAAATTVAFNYRIVIADLIGYRDEVLRDGAPTDIAGGIHAAAALARAIEAVGQQQVAALRAVSPGALTPALRDEIVGARATFDESGRTFTALADPVWQQWFSAALAAPDVVAAQRLADQAIAPTGGGGVIGDPVKWTAAQAAWVSRLSDVQQRVDAAVVNQVSDLRGSQMRRAGTEAAGVVLALAVAVFLTGYVARRITRRLRLLQEAARTVAYQRLPTVVNELRRAAPGTVNPDEVANRAAGDIAVPGSDEIADVAQAFRAVHREAVRVAGEEAVMRTNVADIFVHLSRREQKLVDAVLAQVDLVERDETDPDRLQQLYRLDHLATRMGRINLSLLILGGSHAARVRHEDVPLVKLMQAAISQIEHYPRVRFGMVDNDVAVVSEVVDEVVHLLAELLENATEYSPPESEVWIAGRALGDRVIVQVGDEGDGLSPRQRGKLNEILAAPPRIDVAAVQAMGLTVVGHLAARHGIRVELRPGQRIGTIAEITIPARLFRPNVPADRQFPPAPLPAAPNGHERALPSSFFSDGYLQSSVTAPTLPSWPPVREPAAPVGLVAPIDETVVLPIFQETSGWFRTIHPPSPEGPVNWETAADEGWIAAANAAHPDVTDRTPVGLPLRKPQKHLVPGAAATNEIPDPKRRDPAAIAAAMSAYARGTAARRGQPQP
jgi:signal transduction histidine kinase